MNRAPLVPSLLVALALGACSERSSDDPLPPGGDGADISADDPTTDGNVLGPVTDPDASGEPNADGQGDGITDDPSPELLEPPGPVLGDPSSPDDGPSAAVPPSLPAGTPAARVVDGLQRVVGAALLDLNGRLAGGEMLSEQQDDCLGAFDPAFGEPLLALDCRATRPLSTGEVEGILVERGAFVPSEACAASLAGGEADGCSLAFAAVTVPTQFVSPVEPERRPRPLSGSGVDIAYALDGAASLSVASDADALGGTYRCDIDLTTGSTLPSSGPVGDCDRRLRDLADLIDAQRPSVPTAGGL